MSSIETNTEELQEILQQVYDLPNRSSGGSSEPDLVINVRMPQGSYLTQEYFDDIVVTFSGSVEDTYAKLSNREDVKVVVNHDYYYGYSHFIGTFNPLTVSACSASNGYRWIGVDVCTNTLPGVDCPMRMLHMEIGTNGEVNLQLGNDL